MELKNKKKLLSLFVLVSTVLFVGLIGAITFSNIFPTTTPYVTNESTVNLSYGIHAEDGLSSITHSWNGTNTTLYDSSLVLFMNFDNRSELGENDTIVKDISMYGNNGSVVGGENITWGAGYGKYGGAFNFSGNKSYIQVTDSNNLDFNESTIGFWIKTSSPSSFDIMSKWNYVTGNRSWNIQKTGRTITTQVSYNGSSGVSSISIGTLVNTPINDSNWHFFIFSYNGTHIVVYLDGMYQAKSSWDKGIYFGYAPLYISNNLLTTFYLNGTIDEVMIFNRTLNAVEILNLYNKTKITKYNSTYFGYNTTQIGLNAYPQSSFLCSTNLTGFETCSAIQEIRQISNIKSNFSTLNNIINSYFYGVNDDTYAFGSNLSFIDANGDGSYDTFSDSNWHLMMMSNANIKFLRVNMVLKDTSFYDGVFNTTTNLSNTININTRRNLVETAHERGMKILFIATSVPNWLQNRTSGYCNSNSWDSCSPYDYELYGKLVVDFLNETNCGLYQDTCYVEILNEPSTANNWLNNITNRSDNTLFIELNKLVNSTIIAIKNIYPNIKVGGVANTDLTGSNWLLDNNILTNFADKLDFYSFHIYRYNYSSESMVNILQSTINSVKNNLSSYGFNGELIISEVGDIEVEVLNGSNEDILENYYSLFYAIGLNENISNIFPYFWAPRVNFSASAPYYPYKFYWVSEPLLENKIGVPYNVTKNFAHLCPAGATVYVSSNDDSSIKQVSCKKGNMYSLIVINTDTNSKNITTNLSLTNGSVFYPYTSIMNYETGASIPVSTSGIVQLGVLDSYEILYLSNDKTAPVITINTPTSPTGDVSSLSLTITGDKALTTCSYTLNSGASVTMTNSGLSTEYYAVVPISKFTNVFVVSCKDAYGNVGTATTTVTKTGNEYSILNDEKNPFAEGFRFLKNIGVALIVILIGFILFTFIRGKGVTPNEVVGMILKIILFAVVIGLIISAIE